MNKSPHFKRFLLSVMCFVLASMRCIFAQTEVIVDEGLNTLYDAVITNPGITLILKRGGNYIVEKPVVISIPTTITGETEPASMSPAVVRFQANASLDAGKHLFDIGAGFILQNVGLMGYAIDNQHIGPVAFLTANNISVIIDGCTIQGARQIVETNGHNGLKLIQKNNKIFNLVKEWFESWGGYGTAWGGNSVDYRSYNNTFFACYNWFNFAGAGTDGSELMEHNTYCNTWGETYFPAYSKDYTVKNNIFFNAQIKGYVGIRVAENGDTLWKGDYSDWAGPEITDSLCGDVAVFPQLADSTKSRSIYVTNNLKMYDQKVLDFYAANMVTPQTFFNVSGHKFAEKYGWVIKDNLLQENGNTVDPQFAMGAIPDGAYENMFKQRKEMSSRPGSDFPYDLAWRPGGEGKGEFIWPLPFNLKPTNPAVLHAATDGYPLGDLNWFGTEMVSAWEKGFLNKIEKEQVNANGFKLKIYPNPVCPDTQISYTLVSESHVKLYVCNAFGSELATLVNLVQQSGEHHVQFNGRNLSGGIYFIKVQTARSSAVQKLMLTK